MPPSPEKEKIDLFLRARANGERPALRCERGVFTYVELLKNRDRVARALIEAGYNPQESHPIPFMVSPDNHYVFSQWGIWAAGGIAVPLCLKHPPPELDYVLEDTGARLALADREYARILSPLTRKRGVNLLILEDILDAASESAGRADTDERTLPVLEESRAAMILYTSGTTSRPKGVLTTHKNIRAQTECLLEAWSWQSTDWIVNILPLHHAHGILNILTSALRAGASIEMSGRFDAEALWERLAGGEVTLFMAVPTVYVKLIQAWEASDPATQNRLSRGVEKLRLMISGSAALPVTVLERWREISGHVLLERYGMTEIGMALSNPYRGERIPGAVGTPLPGVEVRLVGESAPGEAARTLEGDNIPGEIQVRGPNVFREYWRKPEATAESFQDDWFLTGDIALRERGVYRILGRKSVDIIKTGGYKVSALEIEEVLRTHPLIRECAVVGVPDPEWGERVAAALVLDEGPGTSDEELRAWARDHLVAYKIPTLYCRLGELPRNVMGKVTKPAIKELF